MSPLEWIVVADVVLLIAIVVRSAVVEARAARARRRVAAADWALLYSWLDDAGRPDVR